MQSINILINRVTLKLGNPRVFLLSYLVGISTTWLYLLYISKTQSSPSLLFMVSFFSLLSLNSKAISLEKSILIPNLKSSNYPALTPSLLHCPLPPPVSYPPTHHFSILFTWDYLPLYPSLLIVYLLPHSQLECKPPQLEYKLCGQGLCQPCQLLNSWYLITVWQVLEITPISDVLIWTPIISCLGNLRVP